MGVTTKHALIKSYTAGGAITKRRICKVGAADGAALQSSAATDFHIGVALDISAASGERLDVVMANAIAEVDFGGTIARGASVTSDASGKAVTATTGQRAVGWAEVSGVSGDVGTVIIQPHTAA